MSHLERIIRITMRSTSALATEADDKENPVTGDSSAIIINGREASLDMSNIRELMLAGTAYINTQAIVNSSGVGTENSNVPMGESISVKGDQIAYLVPPECIGTSGDGADAKSLYQQESTLL